MHMKSSFKDLPWWQKIMVLAAIVTVISFSIIYLPSLLSMLGSIIKWLGSVVISVWKHLRLSAQVPYGLLYLLILLLLFLLHKFIRNMVQKPASDKGPIDPYFHYRVDLFFGIKWRWQYQGKFDLSPWRLAAFCPICDLQINWDHSPYSSFIFYCQQCEKSYEISKSNHRSYSELEDYLCREIQRRIRTGEWKQSPEITK